MLGWQLEKKPLLKALFKRMTSEVCQFPQEYSPSWAIRQKEFSVANCGSVVDTKRVLFGRLQVPLLPAYGFSRR
jgi:hypothetical protein